jgi:hypothetical protein
VPAESNVIERAVSPRKVAWSKLQALNASAQSKGAHEAIPEKFMPKHNIQKIIGIKQNEEFISFFFHPRVVLAACAVKAKTGIHRESNGTMLRVMKQHSDRSS